MTPTDLPPGRHSPLRTPGGGKPEGCAIREEDDGDERQRFIIPPSPGVVSGSQLAFAFVWAFVWTAAIALYVAIPNSHGPVFNFIALVAGLAGEYLALQIFFNALLARTAVERISLGPEGVERQISLGPLRRTRRIPLRLVREFRVLAYPSPRRSARGFGARLYLAQGEAPSPGLRGGGPTALSFALAEGARDEDKFWLASRLNERLRARRETGERKN